MKLKNPTQAELDVVFAERVAGWEYHPVLRIWHDNFDRTQPGPIFTSSADSVLPWLERMNQWERCQDGEVAVWISTGEVFQSGHKPTDFPRAAVIALLRAHGVEIEFT